MEPLRYKTSKRCSISAPFSSHLSYTSTLEPLFSNSTPTPIYKPVSEIIYTHDIRNIGLIISEAFNQNRRDATPFQARPYIGTVCYELCRSTRSLFIRM